MAPVPCLEKPRRRYEVPTDRSRHRQQTTSTDPFTVSGAPTSEVTHGSQYRAWIDDCYRIGSDGSAGRGTTKAPRQLQYPGNSDDIHSTTCNRRRRYSGTSSPALRNSADLWRRCSLDQRVEVERAVDARHV